jgi:hypothetical protein
VNAEEAEAEANASTEALAIEATSAPEVLVFQSRFIFERGCFVKYK